MLHRFRRALVRRRDILRAWLAAPVAAGAVPLAGPVAEREVDASMLSVLDHALAEIEEGSFGRCALCDGEVEAERLELDFTTCVCLDHYTEPEIRGLERDLELAAQVQRQLFPRRMPTLPGVQVAAHVRPARIVGGDYYDFFRGRDDLQGVAIADVMGKGVPASMLMANLQASLRILGPEYSAPHELAGRLNELFRFNLKLIRFITLVLLTIDREAEVLRYCNAGHNPPLRWDAAARSVQPLRPTGPAIGLVPRPPFRSEAARVRAGDLVLLYTDGLVEARNAAGEPFGEERLARYLAAHHEASASEFLGQLRRTILRFTDGRPQDDLALLALKFT